MADEFVQLGELLKFLGIKKASWQYYKKVGAPAKTEKGYNKREWCEFLVARPRRTRDKSKLRENAEAYLNKINSKKPKKQKKQKQKKVTKSYAVSNNETGMFAALERAKNAEVAAHDKYIETLNATGVISTASLESWQKTLDILRKCETDFAKVLERKRVLVNKKEVQDYLENMIEQVKTMFLNLPAKIAPSLESLEWHEIQEKLDIEIREILTELASYE